ncbi:dipicolinate synthase subunit B [Ruminococcaceae bacterium OttesenSCG-928-N02]|nr:dipicolinate synthase subunit B [Ruminococcaceae bacterium OttesenSCG-928-N02]
MKGLRILYALTGSFCTFEVALKALEALVEAGADVTPAMSYHAAMLDTRFGAAKEFKTRLQQLTGKPVIETLMETEPIGPQKLVDIVVVAPCTGNTMSKFATGITDTPVLMACKSQLRNARPVLLALSSNDGLSGGAQNMGRLLNTKNVFFVPMFQDDPIGKPTSLNADYSSLQAAIESAMQGKQLQPVISK